MFVWAERVDMKLQFLFKLVLLRWFDFFLLCNTWLPVNCWNILEYLRDTNETVSAPETYSMLLIQFVIFGNYLLLGHYSYKEMKIDLH